ncbi:MAG: hypothetical protein HOO67_07450, partial [Candidatus Peribacteraceae bacterium]|nr:hypothetical protein [Candidatus Peribacteraceae bacterium]
YDTANHWFIFNDDLKVEGDLTVTGLINGVDITALAEANAPLKVSSGAGLSVHVTAGNYRINGTITNFTGSSATLAANAESFLFFTGSGGLQVRAGAFPTNVSFIALAKVTTNASGVASVTDERVMLNDDRQTSVLSVLHPEFKDSSYVGDGTDNTGQLSVSNDNADKKNFYAWKSTRPDFQDYDILIRVTLPKQFARWDAVAPLSMQYRSSGVAADTKADVSVFDTAGNAVTLNGGANLSSSPWAIAGMTFSGTPVWTPGQTFLVKIHVASRNNGEMHIGDLELRYAELEKE